MLKIPRPEELQQLRDAMVKKLYRSTESGQCDLEWLSIADAYCRVLGFEPITTLIRKEQGYPSPLP